MEGEPQLRGRYLIATSVLPRKRLWKLTGGFLVGVIGQLVRLALIGSAPWQSLSDLERGSSLEGVYSVLCMLCAKGLMVVRFCSRRCKGASTTVPSVDGLASHGRRRLAGLGDQLLRGKEQERGRGRERELGSRGSQARPSRRPPDTCKPRAATGLTVYGPGQSRGSTRAPANMPAWDGNSVTGPLGDSIDLLPPVAGPAPGRPVG